MSTPRPSSRPLCTDREYWLHSGERISLSNTKPILLSHRITVGKRTVRHVSSPLFDRLVHWPLTQAHWVINQAQYDPVTQSVSPLPEGWTAILDTPPYDGAGPTVLLTSPDLQRFQTYVRRPNTTTLIDLTVLPSASAPQDAPNRLRAQLGGRFHCIICHRQHDSTVPAQWEACSQSPQSVLADHRPGQSCSWDPDDEAYDHRAHYYQAVQGLWTPQRDDYQACSIALSKLKVSDRVPVMTTDELADPQGLTRYATRAAEWLRQWQQTIAAREQEAQPIFAQLEQLLPLPHPVGFPRCGSDGTLNPATEQEVTRVRTLVAPQGTVDMRRSETLVLEVHGFGSTSTRHHSRTPAILQASTLFQTDIRQWGIRGSRLIINPNALGLDPTFWQPVTIAHRVMTLRTHEIERG